MIPSLILIIVNKECSIVDTMTFGLSTVLRCNLNGEGDTNSMEHHPATIEHLQVAANLPTKSTLDNEQSLLPRPSALPGPGSSDLYLA